MARGEGGGTGEPDAALGQRDAARDVTDRVVDLLDASDDLRTQSARRLLHGRVTRLTGHPFYLPDFELSRDWMIAFVAGCVEMDGGLSALVEAVGFQRPHSLLLKNLRMLETEAETEAGPADPLNQMARPDGSHAGHNETVARPAGPSAAAPLAEPEPLAPREIAELAQTFTHRLTTTDLLTRAGFPPERLPDWDGRDAAAYWLEVSGLLRAGLLVDGRRRVLAAAATILPANPVFTGRGPA